MNCSRRLYKGNEYVICLPFDVSGVTSMTVNFYTDGAMLVQKFLEDFEISGGTMCVTLDEDDLDYLNDGVLRYEVIYETEGGDSGDYSTNTPYVVVTPAGYTGTTIEEAIQDAYDSGYTQGYEDGEQSGTGGYASGYTDGYADGYASGTTDGYDSGYTSGYTEGYESGSTDGYQSGYTEGYDSGSTDGQESGYESGYTDGYASGYTDGYNAEHDYEKDYFTIKFLDTGSFYVRHFHFDDDEGYFEYATNPTPGLPIQWHSVPVSSALYVRVGSTYIFRGSGIKWGVIGQENGIFMYNTDVRFDLMGNIESLEYGDDFYGKKATISSPFFGMFKGCTGLRRVDNLILPATSLTETNYYEMFYGCENLEQPPALPATELSTSCYMGMFHGCKRLVWGPSLPATIVPTNAYRRMFFGCTSLTRTPPMSATTFDGFASCEEMFEGCTALTQAILPPVASLQQGSYAFMFAGCTSLVSVSCMATSLGDASTTNWLHGVSATGIFRKNAAMNDWTTGENGIPEGWTVVDASI